jgi:hypothetical protein
MDAFDAIAAGLTPKMSKSTADTLLELGLIERNVAKRHFADGLPPSDSVFYSVPIDLHIRWCEHWISPVQRAPGKRQSKPRPPNDAEPELF